MATRHLMFDSMFVERVKSGQKCHTIRPRRKPPLHFEIGDALVLRRWLGKPYRSKQEVILETQVIRLSSFEIGFNDALRPQITVDGVVLEEHQAESLAETDGFDSLESMFRYHLEHFDCDDKILIEWKRGT